MNDTTQPGTDSAPDEDAPSAAEESIGSHPLGAAAGALGGAAAGAVIGIAAGPLGSLVGAAAGAALGGIAGSGGGSGPALESDETQSADKPSEPSGPGASSAP